MLTIPENRERAYSESSSRIRHPQPIRERDERCLRRLVWSLRPPFQGEGESSPASQREEEASPASQREGESSPASQREGEASPPPLQTKRWFPGRESADRRSRLGPDAAVHVVHRPRAPSRRQRRSQGQRESAGEWVPEQAARATPGDGKEATHTAVGLRTGGHTESKRPPAAAAAEKMLSMIST